MRNKRIDLSIYRPGLNKRILKYVQGPVANDIGRCLGVSLPPIEVYLAVSLEEFSDIYQKIAGNQPHESVVACTILSDDEPRIVMIDPQRYRRSYPLSFWTNLKHECVHIAWRCLTGTLKPYWLSEGVAEFISGRRLKTKQDSCWLYIDKERRYRFVTPYSVLRLKANDPNNNKAYWLGKFWVEKMVRHLGWRKIRSLIVSLREDDEQADFRLKFHNCLGIPFARRGLQSIIN